MNPRKIVIVYTEDLKVGAGNATEWYPPSGWRIINMCQPNRGQVAVLLEQYASDPHAAQR